MTIQQLEYFVAVVNQGSFSMAAVQCFVTQPSLSIQIQNLEKELNVVLFDRKSNPVVLTPAGWPILEQARNVIGAYNALKETVKGYKAGLSGKLRLGVIPSLSPYLLPRFIPEFTRRCPDAELEIRDISQADIEDALNRDLIDVAIFAEGKPLPGIREKRLFTDKIYVYVPPASELYKREVIHEHDLDSGRVLTIHEEVWTGAKRDGVKEARKKVKVPYMFMEASVETLMYTADATASVVMIPGVAIDYIPEEKRDRIKVLNRPDACRTIMMAVGRTCMKEKLVEAVRESVMVVAGQYAFADFLRT